MTTSKRITAVAAALVLAGSLIALPQAASAAPLGSTSVASLVHASTAPTCVSVKIDRHWGAPRATVKNNCSTTKRVKVFWAGGQDSACMTIGSGKTKTHTTAITGRFDGLRNC